MICLDLVMTYELTEAIQPTRVKNRCQKTLKVIRSQHFDAVALRDVHFLANMLADNPNTQRPAGNSNLLIVS